MQLEGKAAIVTGGGTGVGRATSLRLAKQGCAVLVNYSRSRDEAEATAGEIETAGGRAIAVKGDVSDDAACRKMVDEAVKAFGRIDVLVNNAGTTKFVLASDLDKVQDEDWLRIYSVNVLGPFHCARAVREPMLAGGGGQIINISSVAAFAGKGSSIPYAASKAALNNLTVALARALAPKIRVNAIAPGFITGRWLQEGLGDAYEKAKDTYASAAPLDKVSEPDDVAAAIMSLVTGSQMITGQVLVCDGGLLHGK
ncbi:MAG: SDR family NAD(P)-dependent oxidoreductase [Planctomycetota bacterium]|nr:MAG: SDR family NAD(P)-dependent oxidoreductase [Planctomycetota bacterium]